jgi:hypothetical protein
VLRATPVHQVLSLSSHGLRRAMDSNDMYGLPEERLRFDRIASRTLASTSNRAWMR